MIRLATEADIRTVARTYGRAFANDPVMRWLIPDDDEYEQIRDRFFGALARRWLHHGTLWCTADGVAVAGWTPPGRPAHGRSGSAKGRNTRTCRSPSAFSGPFKDRPWKS